MIAAVPGMCRGQAAWEYSPYQVRIWVALETTPQLPPELISPLSESLTARADSVMGAVWSVEVQPVPVA
ncbi:MAG TPA: hypothetical protein VFV87_08815, partial [Pirellulaceae bacterium]|nr:hypothetical protein [Pirellulaceae bacterium]